MASQDISTLPVNLYHVDAPEAVEWSGTLDDFLTENADGLDANEVAEIMALLARGEPWFGGMGFELRPAS